MNSLLIRWPLLLVALTLGGCAAAGSARNPSPALATPTAELTGRWLLTLAMDSDMEMAVRLDLEPTGSDSWQAFSRAGAAAEMVSWPVALAGRLLGRMPPRGAIVYLRNGRAAAQSDGIHLTGTLESPMFGRHELVAVLADGVMNGELRQQGNGARTARIIGAPLAADYAARDYPALARNVRRTFAAHLYDPQLVERSEWRAFFRAFDARLARARDDLDVMLAFYALKPGLRMSHLELFRSPVTAALPLDSLMKPHASPATLVTLTFPAAGVALLQVTRWSGVAAEVTRAFERIDSAGSHTLILDIRGNPGGDVTSMAPIAHLLRDSTPAGVFLGRRWYDAHRAPPTATQMRDVRVFTGDNALSLIHDVRAYGAVTGIVPPLKPHFAGEVYLLIDGRTGSASEPLAHLLRSTGRATLVGQRTAGAMLSAPAHPAGDGWVLVLPESDYFAADGVRLEGRGVEPHIRTQSTVALNAVADRMRARQPYAAAVLSGVAHAQQSAWRESERSYREALRLEPDSIQPAVGLGRALQEQRQYAAAFAVYEDVVRRRPDHLSAVYQIGRTAAISGERLDLGERMLRRYLAQPVEPPLPTHAAAHWRLGMILDALGRTTDAEHAFEAALALEPDHTEAQSALRQLRQRRAATPSAR